MRRVPVIRKIKLEKYYGGKMDNRYSLFLFLGTLFIILVSLLMILASIFVIPVLAKEAAAPPESPHRVCQSYSDTEEGEIFTDDGVPQAQSWNPGWRFMLIAGRKYNHSPDRNLPCLAQYIGKLPVFSNTEGALLENIRLHRSS